MNIIQRVTEIQSHQVKTISKIVQIQTLIQAQTLTQQQIEEASNPNPIKYSFDQWSVEESHSSSDNKKAFYINSGLQRRVFTFGQEGLSTTNIISSSNLNLDNKVVVNYTQKQNSSFGQNMREKYYFSKGYTSYSTTYKRNKEPMDTIKRKKNWKNEIYVIVVDPRDF